MAAKKARNKTRNKTKTTAAKRAPGKTRDAGIDAAQAMLTMIATHESTIRKLAEVVVNLHANVRALRDVVEPLASTTLDERVARPLKTLRRITLDE